MKTFKTRLEGVLLIQPEIFYDHRGEYVEIYNEEEYKQKGIDIKFIQDDISVSRKDVLRGIHGDDRTWKLISCFSGRFYLVVVDCRENTAGFGRWQAFNLTEKNRFQVLVPPQYGVAHLALSKRIIFYYKQSSDYNPARQFSYKWNDPKFNISWPIKNPILSKRDESRYV